MTTPEPFFDAVVSTHADIGGDIVQVGVSTWALHGFIAYDGEVLLAEFDDLFTARQALNRIPINDNNSEDPQ